MADVKFRVHGDKQLQRRLQAMSAAAQRRIVRPAVNKALTPLNKAVKRNISEPEWKPLRKSVGKRVQTYGGVIWGGIGARSGFGDMRHPRTGKRIAAGKLLDFYEHGDEETPARAPLRRAFDAQVNPMQQILRHTCWERIRKLAQKR